jgi:hypothetical protein
MQQFMRKMSKVYLPIKRGAEGNERKTLDLRVKNEKNAEIFLKM